MTKSSWDWNAFRLAVIEAGIRGELTADWRAANPDVEPAHVLLERIAEEKAELIRAKQIRKEKPLPQISPDEVPFDIPSSWEWKHLIDVGQPIIGLTYKPSDIAIDGDVKVLKANNVRRGKLVLDDITRLSYDVPEKKWAKKNDILICVRSGSKALIGKAALIPSNGYSFGAFMTVLRTKIWSWAYWFIQSEAFLEQISDEKSTGINQLTQGRLKSIVIPIPPLSEQQEIVRILSALDSGESDGPVHPVVARIQKLEHEFRALAGEYESQEKWLADLRSALLQEAISGQLTADWRAANPDVEPAHILLERIAEEKAELIRTKQIRKEKPLPPISPDEVPFDIPSSWEWTQAVFISVISGGKRLPKNHGYDDEGGYYYLRVSDFENNGHISFNNLKCIGQKTFEILERYAVRRGDLCCSIAGTIGKSVLIPDLDRPMVLTENAARIRVFVNKSFLRLYFESSDLKQYWKRIVADSMQPKLALEKIKGTLSPIPPLEEQQEIVRRLEVQLRKVEALQQELKRSKEAAQLLMKSKLAEVFEPAVAD